MQFHMYDFLFFEYHLSKQPLLYGEGLSFFSMEQFMQMTLVAWSYIIRTVPCVQEF